MATEDSNFVALVDRGIALAKATTLTIGDRVYIDKDGATELIKPFYPSSVAVTTLSSIVALLEAGLEAQNDNIEYDDLYIHVESFDKVTVSQKTTDSYGKNICLIAAKPIENNAFKFGQYYNQEEFNIGLASLFVPDTSLDELIKAAGSIAKQTELKQEDNGISQTVTAKSGVHMVREITLKPRVTLKPFRTFREAEQPASDFVFRVKQSELQGNLCALFEADGGYWKIAAMQNVAIWLQNKLKGSDFDTLTKTQVIY